MKFSQSLIKTFREVPSDADSKNASYLERACFVEKQMAGVYALLPLGFRVYQKIENIIREELNRIGGQEILMNVLQPKELWQETGRWESMKEIFYSFKDARGKELGLGPSHEEQLTDIVRKKIHSYKDLPQAFYQIQTKFRNEPRAKSGLLRGREFIMKDLYSFHTDQKDLDEYYEKVSRAYVTIFQKMGLSTKLVEASGGPFTEKLSHEFQVLTDAGEDTIFYCEACSFAQNKEIAKVKEGDKCPKCGKAIKSGRAIEVGNIFKPGAKYSESMKAKFTDENGKEKDILMGCYGIGLTRCLGTIVEVCFDEKKVKMIWPKNVVPYQVHLISLGQNEKCESIYNDLLDEGIEVLYDDRTESAGKKFADADLIGVPVRLTVSKRTLEKDSVECKMSDEEESKLIKLKDLKNIESLLE